ncbi:hypothetical protein BG011_005070 [Mortierella polycephala]|uniref:Uncharacterized protein n=1 Tax=Mortierella polycephala TaxID=41804 RepID=A0A9P6PX05_9FUNG|nr:hypothetical protein BG011_005070 [Mortierella polycephala]
METQHTNDSSLTNSLAASQDASKGVVEQNVFQSGHDSQGMCDATTNQSSPPRDQDLCAFTNRMEKLKVFARLTTSSFVSTAIPEPLKMDADESPALRQIQGKLSRVKRAFKAATNDSWVPSALAYEEDACVILTWSRAMDQEDFQEELGKLIGKLENEEANEMRCLHRLRMDHQHQLDMNRREHGQVGNVIHDRLDSMENRMIDLVAFARSGEKNVQAALSAINVKLEGLPSQPATPVPTMGVLTSNTQMSRQSDVEVTSPYQ